MTRPLNDYTVEQILVAQQQLNPLYGTGPNNTIGPAFTGHVDVECDCHEPTCMFCEGGLVACTVCHGLEGALPSQCPGRAMTQDEIDDVYAGKLDFRYGRVHARPRPDGTATCCNRRPAAGDLISVNPRLVDCGWVDAPSVITPALYDLAVQLLDHEREMEES